MQKKYDLVLIVTCINDSYIMQMMDSVISNNQYINLLIVFINQSNLNFEFINNNSHVSIIEIKNLNLSSSEARNIGIIHLTSNEIAFSHIMFPDDDSTFPSIFFSQYNSIVKPNSNYLIDIYCQDTKILYKKINYKDGYILLRNNCEAAMSVNMIISFNTFGSVGLLDERLGAGAKYGGGEDVDYYIRSCDCNKKGFTYKKTIYCYHPSPTNRYSQMTLANIITRFINYGNGTIFMLCKHKLYLRAVIICIRAFGDAIRSLLKFNLKLFISFLIAFFSRTIILIKCLVIPRKMFRSY